MGKEADLEALRAKLAAFARRGPEQAAEESRVWRESLARAAGDWVGRQGVSGPVSVPPDGDSPVPSPSPAHRPSAGTSAAPTSAFGSPVVPGRGGRRLRAVAARSVTPTPGDVGERPSFAVIAGGMHSPLINAEGTAARAACGGSLAQVPDAHLGDVAALVAGRRRRDEVGILRLVAELEERGVPAPDGLTRSDWLRVLDPGLSAGAAKDVVTVAQAIREPGWRDLAKRVVAL